MQPTPQTVNALLLLPTFGEMEPVRVLALLPRTRHTRFNLSHMICYRDYHWLPIRGQSRFEADITPASRKREDVAWSLHLRCVAGGPEWRRVSDLYRPALRLQHSGFQPALGDWRNLEHLDFWHWEDEFREDFATVGDPGAPCLVFQPKGELGPWEHFFMDDAIWRVAGRDGGWFTVELAAFADRQSRLEALAGREILVTPDGQEARVEPDAEFWEENAQLYFVEAVRFGKVTVEVPHNVRAPETYALQRARALLGVEDPDHITVDDLSNLKESQREELREYLPCDLIVELHYHGFHEAAI